MAGLMGPEQPDAEQTRWGLKKGGAGYRRHEFDERRRAAKHPNEYNRFGWVVEIDPMDPTSTPVQAHRTGRAGARGRTRDAGGDQSAVVYMGEDSRLKLHLQLSAAMR